MALTKISTGGVKDNAIETTKIADSHVRQSDLDGECVNESKIQISNAGTNGQFLQKQSGNSGGLTWADAASEGTDIKSTGESTAGKFLRTDGDGTSSWTTDAAQLTNINPQNISSGDLPNGVLATGIKANTVDEADLKVSNSPTNGQLLSAQSGNTGGLTWTDPPASAPQLEATADGAITAGKPCIVTTAGKVKQIAETEGATTQLVREAYSEQQLSSTSNFYLEGGANYRCAAYDPDSDTTMLILRDSSNSKHVAKLYSSPSSGSAEATMTLLQTSDVNSGNSDQGIHAVCTLSSRRFLFFYYDLGYIRVKMATVNSSADGFTLSSSAHPIWGSGQEKYSSIMPVETTTNRIAVFVDSNNNSGVVADEKQALIVCDISANGDTWTNRSYALVDEGSYPSGGTIDYDSTNGVVAWVWQRSNTVKFRAAKIAAGTGAAITLSSTVSLNTSGYRCACKYHSNSGSWITFLGTQSSPYTNYLQAHTVNASTMAVTSGTAVAQSGNGGHRAVGLEISSAHALLLTYLENDKTLNSRMATVSGTTVSFNSGDPVELLVNGTDKDRMAVTYQGHNGVLQVWTNRAANGIYIGGGNTTAITSNMTTENYIGIAASTVSDGATATIDISGATNTSQSSLTPGQKYYVQGDGTLGLSEDTTKVFAGTAVAATKLIVNDQQPITTPAVNGQWTLLESKTVRNNTLTIDLLGGANGLTQYSGTYKFFKIEYAYFHAAGASANDHIGLKISTDGSNWLAANYHCEEYFGSGGGWVDHDLSNKNRYAFCWNSTRPNYMGEVTFYDPFQTSFTKAFTTKYTGWYNNGTSDHLNGTSTCVNYASNNAITGIQLFTDSSYGNPFQYAIYAHA